MVSPVIGAIVAPEVSPIRLWPCEVSVPWKSGPGVAVFWAMIVLLIFTVPPLMLMPPPKRRNCRRGCWW